MTNPKHSKITATKQALGFREKVLEVVKNIPTGKTLSYKEVAVKAGSPNAYRKVGSIMKANHDNSVPCHRVIKSDGTLGEYNRGAKEKYKKLKEEGAFKTFNLETNTTEMSN